MKHIRIGTRGSKLALWQANHIASLLLAKGWNTEIVTIDTRGDKVLDVSISKIGSKGVFTEEIEDRLRSGDIDIAVHSAKDMQSVLPDDLELIAFTEREYPGDVLIADAKLDLSRPLKIGTSSTRRVALLKRNHPHFTTIEVRGNLQTRIEKMRRGDCDALLLAYAGVHRMGYSNQVIHRFPLDEFPPPVGQGTIAIEALKSLRYDIRDGVKKAVDHKVSRSCILTERAYLRILEGGCSIPAFCHASHTDGRLTVHAGILSLDGTQRVEKRIETTVEQGEKSGEELAHWILENGGKEILMHISNEK